MMWGGREQSGGDEGEWSNNAMQTCNSQSTFWDSPEAATLLGCVYGIDDVFKGLSECVNSFTDAIQT
jgi:hypothetical protein